MPRHVSVALLLLISLNAAAVCPIFPTHYLVGSDSTYCTHNTIQAAIDAAGSCPVIIDVTREHLYGSGGFCTPSQSGGCHLTINDKINVTLQGWGDGVGCYNLTQCIEASGCPPPASTNPLVTLDGASTAGSVLSIGGHSNVSLRNFQISHGLAVTVFHNGLGGGINFSGYGSLTLENSTVSFNSADYGGGINVNGSGGTALLTLDPNTLILSNTVVNDGGGIRVVNSAHLVADAASTLIAYNHAGSAGGGLVVDGPAKADIGSPGYGGFGVVYDNDANVGGGVAVYAGTNNDTDEGVANFYTTDAQHPVTIEQNFASSRGGAIYAKGFSTYGGPIVWGTVCMRNYNISGNAAPDAAIAYLDWDTSLDQVDFGSRLYLNTASCGPTGVTCAPGAPCNRAYDNVSEDSGGQPTSGSAVVVGTTSSFRADKIDWRGSTGAHLVYIVGNNDASYADPGLLRSCLIAENSVTQDLIVIAGDNATMSLDNCTIANNAIGGGIGGFASVTNSLIYQPGTGAYAPSATYVLANDVSGFPASATVKTLSDPKFVDAANGDYHLRLDSPAIDYAGGLGGTDLDGYPRDVDLAARANQFGPRDLGAYERQSDYACDNAPDALFCNPFEAP